MVNNITIFMMGSYLKFVNLIKIICRDVFRIVPCYSYPSTLFEDCLPEDAVLEVK